MTGSAYRGHCIRPLPEADKDTGNELVLVEMHAKGQVEKIHCRDPAR